MGRVLAGLSALLILAGAAGILVGTLSPWAHVTVFHNVDLNLSGLLFGGGGLCLASALLVLLGARRSALLCVIAAVCVLIWTAQARVEVPKRVKHQVVGTQLALFPLNRLLDQFHINDVEVADWGAPDATLLAPGLGWTTEGALVLLLGALLGLPADPVVRWAYLRGSRARCLACGTRWPRARRALFCPVCGASTAPLDPHHCPACHGEVSARDRHCIHCGHLLSR